MAIVFDPVNKRIILDSTSVSTVDIWTAWVAWIVLSDNSKYLIALTQVGGDDLGGGLFIPLYFFLQNDWRIRPMEANHNLNITGNLFVDGGGVPVVSTIGTYQVNVNYTVSVQAQGISTNGGGSYDTLEQIALAVAALETKVQADARQTILIAEHNATQSAITEVPTMVWSKVLTRT